MKKILLLLLVLLASLFLLCSCECKHKELSKADCITPQKCLKCNESIGNALGHTDGEWITDKEATCTEDGSKHQVCSVCNATIKNETITKLPHTDGEWIIDKNSTCSENGNKHQVCSVCNATIKTETITKLPHTDGEWITDKNSTCSENGSKHQVCSVCNATIKTENLTKLPHTDGEWIIDKNATCTENGSKHQTCAVCNITIDTEVLTKLGHNWKDATCTEPKKCENCNATSGSALGHTTVGLNCSKCGVCTVVFYDNDEFPGIPDLGAMFGISAAYEQSNSLYMYDLKDLYIAGGSNALSRYTSKLIAAGFYLGAGSGTLNIYANKQTGVCVSIFLGDKYVTIDFYHYP